MNELLIIFLKTIGGIIFGYLIVKYFFRKSIMEYIGFVFLVGAILTGVASKLDVLSYISPLISLILQIIIGFVCLFLISKKIKEPFNSMKNRIIKLSEQNLNFQDIDNLGKHEMKDINIAINKLRDNFEEILSELQENSILLSEKSNNLDNLSDSIKNNVDKQTSYSSEIALLLDSMREMVSQNTNNAELTEQTTNKSADEIQKGNVAFLKTLNYINNIDKKVYLISDIAFQTNILSLNASIVASKAGKYANAFKVVAEEVRILADKSKSASTEILDMSEEGKGISEIAGEQLKNMIPDVIESSKLVSGIVSSNYKQKEKINDINSSVYSLTEITDKNSIVANEMSDAAKGLSKQAVKLQNLTNVFKLRNN